MKRGLIGYPLGHSYSVEIHKELDVAQYTLIPLEEQEFHKWMKEAKFDGINVTYPYKEKVIPYLDELSEETQQIGSVNTIVQRDGKLKGYNTDAYGFEWLLDSLDISLEGKKICVLGSGGTSKSISYVLQKRGLDFIIVSRNGGQDKVSYEEFYQCHQDCAVLINATPVGMFPRCEETVVDLTKLTNLEGVIDVIYNPQRTKLLLEAQELGVQSVGGLGMLVAQAKRAVEIFSNQQLDEKRILQLIYQIEKSKENIVLVGMPGVGKTTLGKMLGEELNRRVISIDEEIQKATGKAPQQLIEKEGEVVFRKWEEKIVEQFHGEKGVVFDCGGGVVTQKRVMQLLRYHGKIIWIQRNLGLIPIDATRPLSNSVEKLDRLYQERRPLYAQYADIEIENNGEISEVISVITDLIK